MLWLSKIAARLVLPLGVSLGLLAIALLLLATRRRRAAGLFVATALGGLWLCSIPVVSDPLQASLERAHPPLAVEATRTAGAIVVLGGGVAPVSPPRLTTDLGEGADRVLHAARLFRAGKAPLVVVSGGVPPGSDTRVPESIAMAGLLREWGVPESALVVEDGSRNTHENCLRVKSIADDRAVQEVLLVTSALHMRRALATCRSAGLRAHPAPTDFQVTDAPLDVLDWLPDALVLQKTSQALRELLGYEVYRLRGWIDDGAAAPSRAAPHSDGPPGAGARQPSGWSPHSRIFWSRVL